MSRLSALKMIKRRARKVGLPAEICAHSFRGTGITEYLRNGGDLEVAARIAGHESTRTTQLYNRLERGDLARRDRTHSHLSGSGTGSDRSRGVARPQPPRRQRMNRSELSSRVAADASLSKAGADSVIDAVFSTITDTLARGESVAIAGFGTFTPRARAARQGRNPQSGEPIIIAASTVPTFKAGKTLRDAVRK